MAPSENGALQILIAVEILESITIGAYQFISISFSLAIIKVWQIALLC
jgi:hypothetical protein